MPLPTCPRVSSERQLYKGLFFAPCRYSFLSLTLSQLSNSAFEQLLPFLSECFKVQHLIVRMAKSATVFLGVLLFSALSITTFGKIAAYIFNFQLYFSLLQPILLSHVSSLMPPNTAYETKSTCSTKKLAWVQSGHNEDCTAVCKRKSSRKPFSTGGSLLCADNVRPQPPPLSLNCLEGVCPNPRSFCYICNP